MKKYLYRLLRRLAPRNDGGGRSFDFPDLKSGSLRMTDREDRGFTLLELLVVIGIIGIIMALATVAYTATQAGGRNARRKQDVVAIQNALEQYYSTNDFQYPSGTCKEAASLLRSAWPVDPNTGTDYSGVDACTTTSYCICAEMEGDTAGNSGTNCSWNTGRDYYCAANLQ